MALKKINIVRKITDRSSENFNRYLKDLTKIPIATDDDNVRWCLQAQQGDIEARNKLMEGNLRFVITCAKHFQGQGLDLEDLVSEGNFGLIKAINSYSPTKGVKFISYAVNWIEQSILEALSHTTRTIRIPVSHLNQYKRINKTIDKEEQKMGHPIPLDDIANQLGLSEEKLRKVLITPTKCASLESPFDNAQEDVTCLLDIIPDKSETADNYVLKKELYNKLTEALNCIPIRSRCIIQLFYGINVANKTLEEIGLYLGLTSERVRQLKDEALEDLHKILILKDIKQI